MELKLHFQKTAFSDFYGPDQTNVKEYKDSKYTVGITPTDQNIYVHDCVFQDCLSSSHGGALDCGSNVYKLLVEQTSFISCKTSNSYGGAIYFDSQTYGESILSKTCGFNCSSTYPSNNYGQFAYIYVKDDTTYRNRVNDSTITQSLNEGANSYDALRIYYGNILCPSVNSTNNECKYYAALHTCPKEGTGSPASETCCVSFSSFVNNTANGYSCVLLDRYTTSQRIDTCNIINNKQTSSSIGIIYAYTNLLIKDSCIIGNDKTNKVLYEGWSSCKITISNCTIDNDIFTNGRYYGSVTIIKTNDKTFINALSHISTLRCDSYFDSYGTLTGKPNIPSKTARSFMSCYFKCPANDLLRYIQFTFLLSFLPSFLLLPLVLLSFLLFLSSFAFLRQ
jgi:hypothetical protein